MANKRKTFFILLLISCLLVVLCIVAKQYYEQTYIDTMAEEHEKTSQRKANDSKSEITLLYSNRNLSWEEALRKVVNSYMAENEDVVIHLQPSSGDSSSDDLKMRLATDEYPDVFELEEPYEFMIENKLAEIPGELSEKLENPLSMFEQVFALPIYKSTYGVIYNETIFHKSGLEEPQSYEEFLYICEEFAAQGVVPLAVNTGAEEQVIQLFNYFYQKELALKNPDWQKERLKGDRSFSDAEMQSVLKNYQDFLKREFVQIEPYSLTEVQRIEKLVNNEVAMVFTKPEFFNVISEYDSDFLFSWFFLPAGDKRVAVDIVDSYWAISDACKKDPAKYSLVIDFLSYFYSKENYRTVLISMNAMATTKEPVIYPSSEVQQKLIADYRYAMKSNEYFGNSLTPQEFEPKLYDALLKLLSDSYAAEDLSEKLDVAWNQLLIEG